MAYYNEQKKVIFEPKESEYKGHPVISIPISEDGKFMTFGLQKAMGIIQWKDDIENFVTKHTK